jgi:putative glutamine amidotransferase
MALAKKKPLLAICRGIQVLNVAAEGTLYQDLYTQMPHSIKHAWYVAGNYEAPPDYPTHTVKVQSNSMIFRIFGKEVLEVNSFHHQAVKKTGRNFEATAWTEDGVIEAIEYQGKEFTIGVQWHPERMINGEMIRLFQALVDSSTDK